MNPQTYFEARRRLIEEALEAYFPPPAARPESLHGAIRYSLLNGGKRIRPLLVIAAAEAVGGRASTVLPFACAIEMIHTYSLIHDDLPAMDDDSLRRGKAACHVEFGEGTAILAGDALLTEAFRIATAPGTSRRIGAKRVLEVVNAIAAAAGVGGMVAGQVADLEAEGQPPDAATIEFIHGRKTGALIAAAVRAGALAAAARPAALACLTRFGSSLGLAFQVVDDVLDATGGLQETGKEGGGDERRQKMTYASLLGVAAARGRAVELRDEALAHIARFGKRAEPLRQIARRVVARAEGA